MRRAWCFLLLCAQAFAQNNTLGNGAVTFGTTIVASSWFHGRVYHLHPWATKLPNFKRMKPVGSIYTPILNVAPQSFSTGFPGVTHRFEFFGIDYNARFWIENAGVYKFSLTADDGADLYIDDRLVIDNDGEHPPTEKLGEIQLASGIHTIHVPYYQGPKFFVALVLKVQGPNDGGFRVFSTEDFKPPADAKNW